MSDPEELYCPLLSIGPDVSRQACPKEECAWWLKGEGMCAVVGFVRVLAHHLANIAMNTAKIGG